MAITEQGNIDIDENFEWGFSFSDTDDGDLAGVVQATTQQVSADLGPIAAKLDAILALLPDDMSTPIAPDVVDLTGIENKLDVIIALERVDALTAGDMPDMTGIETKLDSIFECTHTHAHDADQVAPEVDFTAITDKLDLLEVTIGEVRELDFNGDGSIDFGDINNNLADLLVRQEAVETELEAKKQEFIDFKAKKLKMLEKLIIPLLKNLKSNPDKSYIHWPNRSGVLDAQITKVLSITR
jgi:hypothetical protein